MNALDTFETALNTAPFAGALEQLAALAASADDAIPPTMLEIGDEIHVKGGHKGKAKYEKVTEIRYTRRGLKIIVNNAYVYDRAGLAYIRR